MQLAINLIFCKQNCEERVMQSKSDKIENSSKIGQDEKSLISTFAYFLTVIAKVYFLKGK